MTPERNQPDLNAPLRCPACGYLLADINVQARCPECATPTDFQTSPLFAGYFHPDWLAALERGVRFITLAPVWFLGLAVLPFLQTLEQPIRTNVSAVIVVGVVAAASLCVMFGLALFLKANPADTDTERILSPRRIALFGLATALCGGVGILAAYETRLITTPLIGLVIIASPIGIPSGLVAYGLTRHVEYLSNKLRPTDRLERAKIYRYGFLAGLGMSIGSDALGYLAIAAGGRPAVLIFLLISIPLMIIFGALILMLPMFWLHDLKTALRLAAELRRDDGNAFPHSRN